MIWIWLSAAALAGDSLPVEGFTVPEWAMTLVYIATGGVSGGAFLPKILTTLKDVGLIGGSVRIAEELAGIRQDIAVRDAEQDGMVRAFQMMAENNRRQEGPDKPPSGEIG